MPTFTCATLTASLFDGNGTLSNPCLIEVMCRQCHRRPSGCQENRPAHGIGEAMFRVSSFSSPSINVPLFPVVISAGAFALPEPVPLTLAWHVAAYALDVVVGSRVLTKAMAKAYLDEASFTGSLQAKRPSPVAFVAMVRARIIDFGAPTDSGHGRKAGRYWPSFPTIDDIGCPESIACAFAPPPADAANDNSREG